MDSSIKKNILWAVVGLAAIVLLAAAGWFIYFKMQFATYNDAQFKFSISYPVTWKMLPDPTPGVRVVFQSPKDTAMDVFQENINISLQDVPAHLASLKTFSDTIYRQMTVVFKSQIKVIVNKDVMFGQRPGHMLVFETPAPDPLKSVIVWTIKNDRAYLFTYMGRLEKYEELKLKINEAVESFHLQ